MRSYTYGAFSQLGYMRSTDGGTTWGDAQDLGTSTSAPGIEGAAAYTFGDDEVHLTWHGPARLHKWSLDGGETWSRPVTIVNKGAAFGGANALAKDSAGVLHSVTAEAGGVFHAIFNGSSWNPYDIIDSRYNDPHEQRIVVCRGNEVHITYADRKGTTRVWHSESLVDGPHIDSQPIPAAVIAPRRTPAGSTASQAASEPAPRSAPASLPGSALLAGPMSTPGAPIAAGVVPVVALLGVVALFVAVRRRA